MKDFGITKLLKVGEIDNQDVYFENLDNEKTAILLDILDNNLYTTIAYITYFEENGINRLTRFDSSRHGAATALMVFLLSTLELSFIADAQLIKDWGYRLQSPYFGFKIKYEDAMCYIDSLDSILPKRKKGTKPTPTLQPMTCWFGNKNFL